MLTTKTSSKQVKQAIKLTYPISSAPSYMAMNKKMLEDAGAVNLVKEGLTTDDFEKFRKLKELATPGSLFSSGQGGDQGTRAFNLMAGPVTDKEVTKYTTDDPKFVKVLKKHLAGSKTVWHPFTLVVQTSNFANGQTSYTILGHQLKTVSKLNY